MEHNTNINGWKVKQIFTLDRIWRVYYGLNSRDNVTFVPISSLYTNLKSPVIMCWSKVTLSIIYTGCFRMNLLLSGMFFFLLLFPEIGNTIIIFNLFKAIIEVVYHLLFACWFILITWFLQMMRFIQKHSFRQIFLSRKLHFHFKKVFIFSHLEYYHYCIYWY